MLSSAGVPDCVSNFDLFLYFFINKKTVCDRTGSLTAHKSTNELVASGVTNKEGSLLQCVFQLRVCFLNLLSWLKEGKGGYLSWSDALFFSRCRGLRVGLKCFWSPASHPS